jgi:hypothetical protein
MINAAPRLRIEARMPAYPAPSAAGLWVVESEPMTGVDFWELFDNWTTLAMNGE